MSFTSPQIDECAFYAAMYKVFLMTSHSWAHAAEEEMKEMEQRLEEVERDRDAVHAMDARLEGMEGDPKRVEHLVRRRSLFPLVGMRCLRLS